MSRPSAFACVLCALISIVGGCGGDELPELGQVTGVLTAKGKPLREMAITFLPDPEKGNNSPINASGITDDEGRYTLLYGYKGEKGEGAPVGSHRVLVLDTRFSSIPQGATPPARLFSLDYSSPNTTPLMVEVKPGPQTINLDVKL